MTDSRTEPAAHDHSTQSPDLRFPRNAVITQTFANHAHIKTGVMCNQNAAVHDRLNYFPQLRKRGRIRHKLRTYAGQLRVEPVKPLPRVHKIKILFYDFCIFHHTDADSAYAVIVPVRRFHIKNNVSGHSVILKKKSFLSLYIPLLFKVTNCDFKQTEFLVHFQSISSFAFLQDSNLES